MAFVSSPSSINEFNTAYGVITANTHVSPASTQVSTANTQVSTANLSDDTVYAFLASQPNGSRLVYEDLEQIHKDDIEEMDLKWQLALLSMSTRRFFQKTNRKITINGSHTAGYDKSNVKCFNCHKMGHFARERRGHRNQDSRNRNQDSSRRTVNVEETSSKAIVAIDGAGFDWSYMADVEVPTNMALMAFSDSEVYNEKTCSKTCLKIFETLKTQLDDLRIEFNKSEFNLATYKKGLAFVEEQLVFYKKNEVIFCEKLAVLKRDISYKDSEISMLKRSQITDKSRKGVGFVSYNVVPPPPTGLFLPPKFDLSNSGLEEFQQPEFECYGPKTSKSVNEDIFNEVRESSDAPLVKEPKQQENPVRKPVKYAEIYRSQSPRGNQRNWNNQKLTAITIKGKGWNMVPRAVLMKTGIRSLNTARPVNTAHPKTTVYSARPMPIQHVVMLSRKNQVNVVKASTSRNLMEDMLPLGEEPNEGKLLVKELLKLNRVSVVKPYNKTTYELFRGRTPALSFMRPFGCHVTILNILDYLGKFDGKSDEGFFIGYSLNSKAFRVYNIRTRKAEENLHIRFLEDKPIIIGDGPKWLFDIDVLTKSLNYVPVVADGSLFNYSLKNASNDEPQPSSDVGKKNEGICKENRIADQEKSENSTQGVNIVAPSINTEPDMFSLGDNATLEATHVDFFDDETEVDMSNITTAYLVSSTPNTRIHKDYSLDHVIGDVQSGVLTRRMTKTTNKQGFISAVYEGKTHKDLHTCLFACFLSQEKPKKVIQALKDPIWIEAIQEELLQFKNKKDERGIVIRYKARLVVQGYTQEEGIDYDEVFAPIARIEAIRLFLAYASFKDFVVYQMDVKSAFLYGKIREEVYVCQPPGFKDPEFPERVYKKLCTEFETLMHKNFQMSSMGELTFFLGLQVTQKDDGIFISQDKYVDEILKKFGFSTVKTASTPMETSKPLLKDAKAEDIDVHLYRSMIGSLMYLTSSRPDIMFDVCACARFQDSPFDLEAYSDSDYAGASSDRKFTTGGCQFLGSRLISWQCKKQNVVANSTTEAKYVAVASCCGQVLWIQNQMLDYRYNFMNTKIFIDNESTICIVKNPVFHSKTKHIEIRHHFIRDSNEKKLIRMIKIHTDQNVADLLTKAFDVGRFQYLIASIGMLNLLTANDEIQVSVVGLTFYYAQTVNPTIYTSCIKQFWATAKAKTINREVQIQALVDGKKNWKEWGMKILHKSLHSIKLSFQLNGNFLSIQFCNALLLRLLLGTNLVALWPQLSSVLPQTKNSTFPMFLDKQVEGMTKHKEIYVTPSHTKKVFANMKREGKEPITDEAANDKYVPIHSNDPLLSGEDRLKLNELMELCTNLSQRVLDLENTKTSQAAEISKLKERVKKLERRNKSRTPGLKRLRKVGITARIESSKDEGLGAQEDASKQGRKIADLDADAEEFVMSRQGEVEKVCLDTDEVTNAIATTITVDELIWLD
ncbi:putative ribonuclease H-like domain-containing protein [Tanacetum coccineum]